MVSHNKKNLTRLTINTPQQNETSNSSDIYLDFWYDSAHNTTFASVFRFLVFEILLHPKYSWRWTLWIQKSLDNNLSNYPVSLLNQFTSPNI